MKKLHHVLQVVLLFAILFAIRHQYGEVRPFDTLIPNNLTVEGNITQTGANSISTGTNGLTLNGASSSTSNVYVYPGNPTGHLTCTQGFVVVDISTPALWQCGSDSTWVTVGGSTALASTPYYGDGADGTVTFDGTSTVLGITPSGGIYLLPRDVYTSGATVGSSAEVKLNGYRWFDDATLTVNGHVDDDGYGTSPRSNGWYDNTNGAGTSTSNTIGAPWAASISGGNGGASAGNNGSNGGILAGGGGGGGGDSSGEQGGSVTAVSTNAMPVLFDALRWGYTGHLTNQLTLGAGGGNGGTGACGGGGSFGFGAGGVGGGISFVMAQTIAGTGSITANGAPGAATCSCASCESGTPGAGGGAGGAGGYCYLGYSHRVGSIACAASGGSGAPGGAGSDASAGGAGGAGGSGLAWTNNLSGDGS